MSNAHSNEDEKEVEDHDDLPPVISLEVEDVPFFNSQNPNRITKFL